MRASHHREGNFPSGRSCPTGRRSSHPGGAVPPGRRSFPTGAELPEGDVPSGRRSSVREKEVSHWDGVALRKEMRSEEHTSELQSHSFISYAVFYLTI